jgi:hypothetical protein
MEMIRNNRKPQLSHCSLMSLWFFYWAQYLKGTGWRSTSMRCIISIVKVFLFLCSIIHLKVHKDLNRNHGNERALNNFWGSYLVFSVIEYIFWYVVKRMCFAEWMRMISLQWTKLTTSSIWQCAGITILQLLLINWMVIRFLTSSGNYFMHIQERTSSTIWEKP